MTSKPWKCREGYRCLFGDRGGARRGSGGSSLGGAISGGPNGQSSSQGSDSADEPNNVPRLGSDDDVQSLELGGSSNLELGGVQSLEPDAIQTLDLGGIESANGSLLLSGGIQHINMVTPQYNSVASLSSWSSPQPLSTQSNDISLVNIDSKVGGPSGRPRIAFVGSSLPFMKSVTGLGDVQRSGCIDRSIVSSESGVIITPQLEGRSLLGLTPFLCIGSALFVGMCLGKLLGLYSGRRYICSSSRKETINPPSVRSLPSRPTEPPIAKKGDVATAPILVETVIEEEDEKTTADSQTLKDGLWMVPCVLVDGEWVVPHEDLAPPLPSPPSSQSPHTQTPRAQQQPSQSPSHSPSSPSIPNSSPARQQRGTFGPGKGWFLPLLLMICIRIPSVLGNPVGDILSSSPAAAAGLAAASVGVAAIGANVGQRTLRKRKKVSYADTSTVEEPAASSSTKKIKSQRSRSKSTSAAKLKVDESEADDEGKEEEDEQSFSQPDAEFPKSASGSKQVNAFLHGEEESKTFKHFNDKTHAERWAAKYFNGGHGAGSGYCAVAEVVGNAMTGFHVRVTKIMNEDGMGDESSNKDETPVDARNRSRTIYKDERGNIVNHPKSYSCAPSDWDTNRSYHPMNVRIWRAWLSFYTVISSLKTKSGQPIDPKHIIGPHLNWDLKPNEYFVVFMLRYCPQRLTRVLKGRHPAMAMNKNGECISATWDLVRISTPGAYEKGCKLNFWPFSFDYRGSPKDVYGKVQLVTLMVAWVKFLRELFRLDVKIMLCSRGVRTDIEKHVFTQGRNNEERKSLFHKFWLANKSKFFSISPDYLCVPCHPECLLNGEIKAQFANGFKAICSLHDSAYTNVEQYVLGDDAENCQVGSDIFNEEVGTPGYKRRMEACAAARSRATAAAAKYRIERSQMADDINNATGRAKTRAVNKLIEAIRVKSATGVKRSKAAIGRILGSLVSRLGAEIVSDMSDELGVAIVPSKTLAAGTRKVGSGTKTIAQGRKSSGVTGGMMDEAFRLMQTKEYKSMQKGAAQQAALEAAGFKFDEEGTQMERYDQFGKVTLHGRKNALSYRMKSATKG